ncbi:MAG: hypothetical protein JST84_04165 [Acidobacteria bacterium]|nr:hypothetical protein [Acidobacteriota bacterium]
MKDIKEKEPTKEKEPAKTDRSKDRDADGSPKSEAGRNGVERSPRCEKEWSGSRIERPPQCEGTSGRHDKGSSRVELDERLQLKKGESERTCSIAGAENKSTRCSVLCKVDPNTFTELNSLTDTNMQQVIYQGTAKVVTTLITRGRFAAGVEAVKLGTDLMMLHAIDKMVDQVKESQIRCHCPTITPSIRQLQPD